MGKPPIILFLGNQIFTDDRVGLEIGERLKKRVANLGCDVELLESGGLPLIDYLEGRPTAVIIDAVKTDQHSPGTILKLDISEFRAVKGVSPHYAGLPEAVELMRSLSLDMPPNIHILAIEVKDPFTLSTDLSEELTYVLNEVAERIFNEISLVVTDQTS